MKKKSVEKKVLDNKMDKGCHCGCAEDIMFIHARCHPQAGLWAAYEKRTGLLTILCKECRAEVVTVRVVVEE